MKYLLKIDILSPNITLYQNEYRAHTSGFGGFLTIISLLSCVVISFLLSIDFIFKKNPSSSYYKKFEKEAGTFYFNSVGMFHFFRFSNNYVTHPKINTKYVRFIGIRNITLYLSDRSILNKGEIEYWIYDNCINGIDNQNLDKNLFIDFPDFESHVCLRYYYNPLTKKFCNNTEKDFLYPYLIHGTANKDNLFYYITIETCRNNSHYNLAYREKYCGTKEEITEFRNKIDGGDLYFIDNYVDVSNYKNPIIKFIQSVSGTMNSIDVPIYHLLFNPLRIITHASVFSDGYYFENSFLFDVKEPKSREHDEYSIVDFGFWMGNNFEIYDRAYKKLQNVLADLGGILKIVIFIAQIINYPYHQYVILHNTSKFLYQQSKVEKKIVSTLVHRNSNFSSMFKKEFKKKSQTMINNYISKSPLSNHQGSISPSVNIFNNDSSVNRINKVNISITKMNSHKTFNKRSKSVTISEIKNKLGFCYFLRYIFQKNKQKEPIFLINRFRVKLISEEHLYHSHLKQVSFSPERNDKNNRKNSHFTLNQLYEKL